MFWLVILGFVFSATLFFLAGVGSVDLAFNKQNNNKRKFLEVQLLFFAITFLMLSAFSFFMWKRSEVGEIRDLSPLVIYQVVGISEVHGDKKIVNLYSVNYFAVLVDEFPDDAIWVKVIDGKFSRVSSPATIPVLVGH